MKVNEFKFMQLCGNCACLGYLGKDRIKGPVDNVVGNGTELIKALINSTYLNEILAGPLKIKKREPSFEGDCENEYHFKSGIICHNDPTKEKYQKHLSDRLQDFQNHLNLVKTDSNYYFTINLNEWYIDKKTQTLIENRLEDSIIFLKEVGILDKVIFIGTKYGKKKRLWFHYYSDEVNPLIKKYNLKYIDLFDVDVRDIQSGKSYNDSIHLQFLNAIESITK